MTDLFQTAARRVFQDVRGTRENLFDHDDDKYKRRPASEWVRRLWKCVLLVLVYMHICMIASFLVFRNARGAPPQTRSASSIYKRYCMLGILLVLGVVVFFLIMSSLGRYVTEDDPSYDPAHNPLVHVQQVDGRSM